MEPLLTERLILRPFSLDNAKDIYELNGDPDVLKYTGDKPFGSTEEAKEFILNYNHFEKWERGRWGVFLRENNTFIGWCGLKYHEDTGETDLGYRFKKAFWGNGYGTEAASICIKDGFTRLHLQRIYAEAYAENIGSIRIMQKVGMKFLKDTLFKDAPGKIYEMLKTNYK
ncbi:MAG: GNAT family N-acetyltransferase [Saprospiraceae bacterium]|nr:GNAT family N-acetyltransferase [Saprospiraceae bacterium]